VAAGAQVEDVPAAVEEGEENRVCQFAGRLHSFRKCWY
jgi:hypothetical protein